MGWLFSLAEFFVHITRPVFFRARVYSKGQGGDRRRRFEPKLCPPAILYILENSTSSSRAQAQGWLRTGRVTHSGGTRWCQRGSCGHHGELMRQLNACGFSLSDLFGQSLGKRGSLRWLAPLVRGRHEMGRVPRVSLMGVRGHMQAIG